jgi:hypothetical protein
MVRYDPSHAFRTLLNTEDYDTAYFTGRDGPADPVNEDGLRLDYDGTGTIPSVSITGSGHIIELNGEGEIHQLRLAMDSADNLAKGFGPPIPYLEWKARQT